MGRREYETVMGESELMAQVIGRCEVIGIIRKYKARG